MWHSERKATHSDTVDLLQCGIQREKPLIQTLLIFCSVAFREKGCTAGRHSGAFERTAQEGATRVEAEYPPLHHPAGCPTTKPTQKAWPQNPHPQTTTHQERLSPTLQGKYKRQLTLGSGHPPPCPSPRTQKLTSPLWRTQSY